MKSRRVTFVAELIRGPDGAALLVPFDPEQRWSARAEPLRIGGRVRSGHPVRGTLNGHAFSAWIGRRWGRCYLRVDDALLAAAGVAAGDSCTVVVERMPASAPAPSGAAAAPPKRPRARAAERRARPR